MRKSKLLCILLAIVLVIGLSGSGFAITIEEDAEATIGTGKNVPEEKIFSTATLEEDFADDRVMVVLTNAASLKLKTYKSSDFSEILCASVNDLSTAAAARVEAKMNGKSIADVCKQEPDTVVFSDFYEVNTDTYHQTLCLTLPSKSKQGVLDAIKILSQRDDVKYAGPDYVITAASTTPNDTYYSSQWALAKIKMPQAWDIETGRSRVIVGVLDTGIFGLHPDMESRLLVNKSRDFTSGSAATVSVLEDPNGHGTGVASIIGAIGNNGAGIAGVAWNIRQASLRVLRSDGKGYSSWAAAAINYATSAGIPILNMSIAWDINNAHYYNVFLDTCISNYPGLVVCAAGNESANLDLTYSVHPADMSASNIISVGSSTQNDTKSSTSNYGATAVDIFAPGEGIRRCKTNGGYTTAEFISENSGTSFAAPHVTGVAALMLAECSSVSTARMKSVIMNTSDYFSALSSYCVCGGRLNAYKALNNVHSYTHTPKNASYHTSTCACGTTKTLEHSFIIMGNRQMCADCGYTK